MLTKFPLYILHHPFLSIFVILCIGFGLARLVQARAGRDGLVRARDICLTCFYVCLALLALDGVVAWYARTLNPDGYALLYPLAAALILLPLAAIAGILVLIFKSTLRR